MTGVMTSAADAADSVELLAERLGDNGIGWPEYAHAHALIVTYLIAHAPDDIVAACAAAHNIVGRIKL